MSWQTRIAKLKEQLPNLKDTAHIDCLRKIAVKYLNGIDPDWDSAKVYSWKAVTEARNIHNKKWEGFSMLVYAMSLNMGANNPSISEKFYKEALRIGIEIKNEEIIANAFTGVGRTLYFQSKFKNAFDTLSIAADYFRKLKDTSRLAECLGEMGGINRDAGYYEKAFEFLTKAIALGKASEDTSFLINRLLGLADIYQKMGDYQGAKKYILESKSYLLPQNKGYDRRHFYLRIGELHLALNNFDSAFYYYDLGLALNPVSKLLLQNMGELYLALGQYDSALYYFNKLAGTLERNGNITMASLLDYGKVWLLKKDYTKAINYSNKALVMAKETGARQNVRDALQLLASIYKKLNSTEKALDYYQQYISLKDSIINDQFKGKLYEFKRLSEDEKNLAQIEVLKKEKQISEQQLKWEKQHARQNLVLKNILIAGIILIVVLGLFIFRSISLKRKNEKLLNDQIQSQLQHKATDLEMQALRAQMNPHFIFNCLSSINRFILKNETEIASDYLTRFSRLIRLVLIHSQSSMILLKEEIEMLRLYLDMEQLRFKNSFDYNISFTNSIDPEIIFIPPLLLQPFCENAIWHGLMNKQGQGHLEIRLSMQDNILSCTITDNGVGRAKAAELKSKSGEKQKSLGLKITAERLALINEEKGVKTNYEIEDVIDDRGNIAGTTVILRIRYKENIKEPSRELSRIV